MRQCQNECGAPARERGTLCGACYQYQRRKGVPRPVGRNLRREAATRGDAHPAWKGDEARSESKRARAQRAYALGDCERCGKPATERHHKNGDTGNNDRANIEILCRRCHMTVDGRLAEFLDPKHRMQPQPPKPCANCGRLRKPLRKGRCHTCNEYQRRYGKPRPYIEDGRVERVGS